MDCINQILDYYNDNTSKGSNRKPNPEEIKIWTSNTIRELMEGLKDKDDYLKVKNCMLLVLNLFFDHESPDNLNRKGKSSKSLSTTEKKLMHDSLRKELYS